MMTHNKLYELKVDMEDYDGSKASAVYTVFSVGSESNGGYVLQVGGFIDKGAGERSDVSQCLCANKCGRVFIKNICTICVVKNASVCR